MTCLLSYRPPKAKVFAEPDHSLHAFSSHQNNLSSSSWVLLLQVPTLIAFIVNNKKMLKKPSGL